MTEMYELKWLYGVKKFKIKPPWIKQKTTKGWFGMLQHEYWIVLEYVRIGPFKDYIEAYCLMKMYHV